MHSQGLLIQVTSYIHTDLSFSIYKIQQPGPKNFVYTNLFLFNKMNKFVISIDK